jgi:toxin ParE1/3/4
MRSGSILPKIVPPQQIASLTRFYERLVLLAGQPLLGRLRPELAPNLRSFPVDNHVIFYRPIDHGIEVARVLHGARDIDALFRT